MNWGSNRRRKPEARSQKPEWRTVIFWFLASGFWLPSFSLAQQRPLLTEDPRLIANGSFVMESGFGYAHRARFPLSGLGGDEYSVFVNGLNFGLGPRAEFQINGVVQNLLHVSENGSGWRNDWGDWSFSTKIKVLPETHVLPIISFRPTVVLPNSNDSRGIGVNSTQVFGSILTGKSVGSAFVFVLPVNARISLLSEWNGWKNPRHAPSPGTESRAQVRLGMQIRTGGVRWDVAGTAGLTHLDPRGGVVFGLTKEFQLWK